MRMFALTLLFLAACGPASEFDDSLAPVRLASAADLQRTLTALPICGPSDNPRMIEAQGFFCTKRACTEACCNTCNWRAKQDGALVPTTLFQLPTNPMDCELAAWNEVFASTPVDVDAGCRGAP